jgi:hypothetical protein
MKHADIRQKLSAYLDGAVTPEERVNIEEHLKSCRICSVALVELKKTVSHVRGLEELEPPAWMAQKIMARVKLEAEGKMGFFRRLFFPLHIKLPIEAIAMVLVTVTGYLLFRTVQPEMQLAKPPAREEYYKTMPEVPTTSVPSKFQTKIEGSGKAKNEKPLPLKPPEQNPKHYAREAEAPVTAPGLDYGSSINKSVSPAAQIPELMKKEETKSAPAPEEERSMQRQRDAVESSRSKAESFSSRTMKSMHEKPETNFSIILFTRASNVDGKKIEKEVEKEVERLGGRVVKTEPTGNPQVLTIQLEGQKINALMERLRIFGMVTGREVVPGSAEKNAELTVQIEIRQESRQ